MGEAKRRKKALGATYGDVPPVLVPGSRQFEEHLDKFTQAWEQQLAKVEKSIDADEIPNDEKYRVQQQQIKGWLKDYLKPYSTGVQQQLLGGILDAFYAELEAIENKNNPDNRSEGLYNWFMEEFTLYPIFKPYLSSAQKQRYDEPLRICYDSILAAVDDMEPDELEANQKMLLLLESCLVEEEAE